MKVLSGRVIHFRVSGWVRFESGRDLPEFKSLGRVGQYIFGFRVSDWVGFELGRVLPEVKILGLVGCYILGVLVPEFYLREDQSLRTAFLGHKHQGNGHL